MSYNNVNIDIHKPILRNSTLPINLPIAC